MKVDIHKIAMAAPDDVSGLERLIDAGEVVPHEIVAFIGKTEGNGGANDFTRGFATLAFKLLLSRHLGMTLDEVGRRVAFVWSGGTEGVLSPHTTIFCRTAERREGGEPRLVLGVAETRSFAPEEIGTLAHVREVASAVTRARQNAGISDLSDVHYVQVKGPLLTSAAIADADARGATLVTRDPNGSKTFARGAMALGVGLALGEVHENALVEGIVGRKLDVYSAVASTSAGGELETCEVLLFGNAPGSASGYRVGHGVLKDVIDAEGVRSALATSRRKIRSGCSGARICRKAEICKLERISG